MYYLDIYGTEELSMKKKESPRKEKGRRKFVGAAVAICPAKYRLCFLEVRKYEHQNPVRTRCSTQEYVAHNYILHKVLEDAGRGDGQTVL